MKKNLIMLGLGTVGTLSIIGCVAFNSNKPIKEIPSKTYTNETFYDDVSYVTPDEKTYASESYRQAVLEESSFIENVKEEPKKSKVIKEKSVAKKKAKLNLMYAMENVNMRTEPSTDTEVITTIPLGSQVKVTKDLDTWCKISYNDEVGYIKSEYLSEARVLKKVSTTAYYNQYNRDSASGRPLIANHTLAGNFDSMGRSVNLYVCNDDNSVGEYLGTFTFDDLGYGQDTGYGESKVLSGRNLGTIETGECVDIYMNTYEECMNWGRKPVYIEWLD